MYTTIARWYVKEGYLDEAKRALAALAERVQTEETDTWGYLVHNSCEDSLPPASPNEIVFVEIYKDPDAFIAHVTKPDGPFQDFLKESGHLFVSVPPGDNAFFMANHIDRMAGFLRTEANKPAP